MSDALSILYVMGITITIGAISIFLKDKWGGKNQWISKGIIFAIANSVSMLYPLVLPSGIGLDGRSVFIFITGLFFGLKSVLIVSITAVIIELITWGADSFMGMGLILWASIIGVIFHYKQKEETPIISIKKLFLIGVLVQGGAVALMLTLPKEYILTTLRDISISMFLANTLIIVAIGKIISEANREKIVIKELQEGKDKLLEIKKSREEALVLSENNFRMIFEHSADAILIFKHGIIIDGNKAAVTLLGENNAKNIIGKGIVQISPRNQPDGQSSTEKSVEMTRLCREKGYQRFEWTNKTHDGTLRIFDITLTPIQLEGEEVLHALMKDITEHIKMKNRLEVLIYKDELTGAYNRRFFEKELERLDNKENLPLTIIMGDVNGLKLLNDSFGHASGDKLLIEVYKLMQQGCRTGDDVFRIGGDEFIIIMPNTTTLESEEVIKDIQKLVKGKKIENIDVSISFGWSTKEVESKDMDTVTKEAEDYLYRNKFFTSIDVRNKSIKTIMKALYSKNEQEKIHSKSVAKACIHMGVALGLSDERVEDLEKMGSLHDIGKIAISETILNKKGRLTEEEWLEIRNHTKAGYRILSTVNIEVAKVILSHHEYWDGRGYPEGLKGEEIPLEARVVAVVDSFDDMISNHEYKELLTCKEALIEIEKYAGIQFDPDIVELFIKLVHNKVIFKNIDCDTEE